MRPEEISIIVAMTQKGNIIGQNTKKEDGSWEYSMPWERISEDMKHFSGYTKGNSLIMGRKTYESIGKPLPGRQTIVMTRQQDLVLPQGVTIAHSLEEALEQCEYPHAYIGGGSEIYKEFLPLADKLIITWIERDTTGNVAFPRVNWNDWKQGERVPGKKEGADYAFQTYTRRA